MIYGYLDNGFCLVAHKGRKIIFLSEYHGRCSTFQMYIDYMQELKDDKIHEEISPQKFDITLIEAFDNIFAYEETDILNVSLQGVKQNRVEDFGFYAEPIKNKS